MKVLFLIEDLGSGGAQRQMSVLASSLARCGVHVEILTYYPDHFFRGVVEESGVQVTMISSRTKLGRIWAIRRAVRSRAPDVVVAFLSTPATLAELAGLPSRQFALVVSERSGRMSRLTLRDRAYFSLHRLADVVVSNSESLRKYIATHAPTLQSKLRVIQNCVDLEKFQPAPCEEASTNRILVVARFSEEKNAVGLIRALAALTNTDTPAPIRVDWYGNSYFRDGRPTNSSNYYLSAVAERARLGLEDCIYFHDHTHELVPLYQAASAVCLPSLRESFSNVLSEAAACGRPLLASDVGDNGQLVVHEENGLLFDPHCIESIATSLRTFLSLSSDERRRMGARSRRIAEVKLAPDRFVQEYVSLLEEVTGIRIDASAKGTAEALLQPEQV